VLACLPAWGYVLDLRSSEPLAAPGITVHGRPERIGEDGVWAVRFSTPRDWLEIETPDLSPAAGTVSFRVRPRWPEGDRERHTFFHVGTMHEHITVFRHDGRQVFLVYKGGLDAWQGVRLDTGPWVPGEWHEFTAGWKQTAAGDVFLALAVDGVVGTAAGARLLPHGPDRFLLGSRGPGEPCRADVSDFRLDPRFRVEAFGWGRATGGYDLEVDARQPAGTPMPRPFSFTTPWNSESYRVPFAEGHPYFRLFQDAGFEMVRLVAFSEGWLWGTRVSRGPDDRIQLDFSDFDRWVDVFRSAGAEPYIRLAYQMPEALTDPESRRAGRGYCPPRDEAEWESFIRRIVEHCTRERDLGVRYWVTMLNEADIEVRAGRASWEDMFRLYALTTRAVKAVAPDAKVGGPATCGPLPGVQDEALRRYFRFCREQDLPPDFVCFHQYGREHPRGYEEAAERLRAIMAEEYPGLDPEVFLDEWSLWAKDERQNTEYAAAYLAAGIHYQIRAGVDRSSIVSFNPHVPEVRRPEQRQVRRGPFRHGELGPAARFYRETVALAGADPREVLYTHPPHTGVARAMVSPFTFARFRQVSIPSRAVLQVATAQAFVYDEGDGCRLSITVHDQDETERVLQAQTRVPEWQEHRIDLSGYAGREVDLEFRIDSGAASNSQADHALWAEPRVTDGQGRVTYDFLAHVAEVETGTVHPAVAWYNARPTLPMIKDDIVTPVYFTWWLLNRLRGRRLQVVVEGRDGIHRTDTLGALACQDQGVLRVLVWRFDPGVGAVAASLGADVLDPDAVCRVSLSGLPARVRYRRWLIDHEHTNPYTQLVLRDDPEAAKSYTVGEARVDLVEDRELESADQGLPLSIPLGPLAVTLLEFGR
jgi:hypothetical protein